MVTRKMCTLNVGVDEVLAKVQCTGVTVKIISERNMFEWRASELMYRMLIQCTVHRNLWERATNMSRNVNKLGSFVEYRSLMCPYIRFIQSDVQPMLSWNVQLSFYTVIWLKTYQWISLKKPNRNLLRKINDKGIFSNILNLWKKYILIFI